MFDSKVGDDWDMHLANVTRIVVCFSRMACLVSVMHLSYAARIGVCISNSARIGVRVVVFRTN